MLRSRRTNASQRWAQSSALTSQQAISLGLVGKVDVTGHRRGILRSPGGSQTLFATIGGTVQRLRVRSGDKVDAGQPLLTLDATALRVELQQSHPEPRAPRTSSLGEPACVARTGVDEIREQMHNIERGRLALEQELAQTQLQQILLRCERNEQLQRARRPGRGAEQAQCTRRHARADQRARQVRAAWKG